MMENNGLSSNTDVVDCADSNTGNCHLCSESLSLDSLYDIIGCDLCSVWVHTRCVEVFSAVEMKDHVWKCDQCMSRSDPEMPNKPQSRSSKRSSRAELELQKLQEEKELQLKALEDEEKTSREFQRRKTQIETEYLLKKYDCIEASDGGSVKSRSSHVRSKQIVETWLEKSPTEKISENRSEKGMVLNIETNDQRGLISASSSTSQSMEFERIPSTHPEPLTSQCLMNELEGQPPRASGPTYVRSAPRISFLNLGAFPKVAQKTRSTVEVNTVDSSMESQAGNAMPNISQPKVTWVSNPGNSVPIPSVGVNASFLPKDPTIRLGSGPIAMDMSQSGTNVPWKSFQTTQVDKDFGLISAQLASRQAMQYWELPKFSGDPTEWRLFISSYQNSTEACGYKHAENLARLQRSLTGQARELVKSQLHSPELVPEVMETLQMFYGRPELLINALLTTLRNTPSPKLENLPSIIAYGLAVKNTVACIINVQLLNYLSNPLLLQELVGKLPTQLQIEWTRFKRRTAQVSTLATFAEYMNELVVLTADLVTPTNAGSFETIGKAGLNDQRIETESEKYSRDNHRRRCSPSKDLCILL
ncbi:uncharacterized protein LOC129755149 [Uranotaenia lowii]|uniref:uncharacterized protein LOC129755149 n=1 Tax=Uranotaenia lowii TaxID=190385 RepID=UPI00247A39E5|nr:uncharacterized protein LOC129755149 [Uranotaenia lowii]